MERRERGILKRNKIMGEELKELKLVSVGREEEYK